MMNCRLLKSTQHDVLHGFQLGRVRLSHETKERLDLRGTTPSLGVASGHSSIVPVRFLTQPAPAACDVGTSPGPMFALFAS